MIHLIDTEAAETLALRALGYLAGEPERIVAFFTATGLQPQTLRAAASEPGFLLAVLDYLLADEALLLEFAANMGFDPQTIGRARDCLAGPRRGDDS